MGNIFRDWMAYTILIALIVFVCFGLLNPIYGYLKRIARATEKLADIPHPEDEEGDD